MESAPAGHRELMRLRAEVARLRTAPERDEEGVGAGLVDIPEEPSESATNAPPRGVPGGTSSFGAGGWDTGDRGLDNGAGETIARVAGTRIDGPRR